VFPALDRAGGRPTVGTPEWCALGDDDPVKLASLLDAAQQWARRRACGADYLYAPTSNELEWQL